MVANKKKKARASKAEIWNIHHPEIADKIEYSFTCKGVKYYQFKKDSQIRYGRYMVLQNFLQEVNFRMSTDTLKTYITKLTDQLNGTKGVINVGNALELLGHMKHLTELAFEPDTVYRMASVLFFDENENLIAWDKAHNEKKINAWKSEATLDFFYKRPFIELTGLRDISETDLQNYLDKVSKLTESYSSAIRSL